MKNKLTLDFVKQMFRPNDNDKHVDAIFSQDDNGVQLIPVAVEGYKAGDYIAIAGELSAAGFNEGMLVYSLERESDRKHAENMLAFYQLSADAAKMALEISGVQK